MNDFPQKETLPNNSELFQKKLWLVWVFVFIFWTLIGAIAAVQEYIAIETRGNEVSLLKTILTNLPIYFWALSTPLIFFWGQRFLINDKDRWVLHIFLHVLLSLIFAAIYLGIVAIVTESLRDESLLLKNVWSYFRYRFGRGFHVSVLTYWAVLGSGFAIDFYNRLQEREFQSATKELELETQIVQAKLDALKMQLNPHFLFNTLNTVSAIMSDDLKGARRVMARLSELLRINLETSNQQTISFKKELDLLGLYLDIEHERFKEKLEVKMDVPSETWECIVPHFILQPLVENAIKHGIANKKEKGLIEIKAKKEFKHLRIEIKDNGKGYPQDSKHGVGLKNTIERLEKLYEDDFEFSINKTEKVGTIVSLLLPCRTENNEKN